jgi:hypothetical protein
VRRRILFLVGLLFVVIISGVGAQLPDSALSVQMADGKFIAWWYSSKSPAEWKEASPVLARAVVWREIRPGLESSLAVISGNSVGWRVQLILVRLSPELFTLQLKNQVKDLDPGWSLDSVPADAALAVNAGQFEAISPWGWFVQEGQELQPPGFGPLSTAVVVDSHGKARLLDAAEISAVRTREKIYLAFQSYPAILVGDGLVPAQLKGADRGVDLKHRDSRLAIGLLRDGRLLLALTRLGGTRLPFGPTTPEMAAIMGGLGCCRAVLLDGGLSGQLLYRDARGRTSRWPGFRDVPLGLLAFPK